MGTRLVRQYDQPPADSEAEDALLSMCLVFPEKVGQLDLSGYLYFVEYRTIWRAMRSIHQRTPGLNIGEFWIALRQEMCGLLCDSVADHQHERWNCEGFRYLQTLTCESASAKDVGYWTARVELCAESRAAISVLSDEVAAFWRVPARVHRISQCLEALERTAQRFGGKPLTVWEVDAL